MTSLFDKWFSEHDSVTWRPLALNPATGETFFYAFGDRYSKPNLSVSKSIACFLLFAKTIAKWWFWCNRTLLFFAMTFQRFHIKFSHKLDLGTHQSHFTHFQIIVSLFQFEVSLQFYGWNYLGFNFRFPKLKQKVAQNFTYEHKRCRTLYV